MRPYVLGGVVRRLQRSLLLWLLSKERMLCCAADPSLGWGGGELELHQTQSC